MNKTQSHIHRLKKHQYPNGTKVYFCTNNCSFKIDVPLAFGKEVLCNICYEPFIMTEYSLKLIRPHCSNCGKIKIKDADGKSRFVQKPRVQQAIADMSKSSVSSLRERLGSVVTMEKEEDI